MILHSFDIEEVQASLEDFCRDDAARSAPGLVIEGSDKPVTLVPVNGTGDWSRLCLRGNKHLGYAIHIEFFDSALQSFDCFRVVRVI